MLLLLIVGNEKVWC